MKLELVPVPTSDSTGRSPSTPMSSASPSTSTPRSGPRRQLTPPGSAGSIVLSTGLDAISDMVPGTVKGLYLVVNDIASAREELLGRATPSTILAPVGGGVTYAKSATPTATPLCFNRWTGEPATPAKPSSTTGRVGATGHAASRPATEYGASRAQRRQA